MPVGDCWIQSVLKAEKQAVLIRSPGKKKVKESFGVLRKFLSVGVKWWIPATVDSNAGSTLACLLRNAWERDLAYRTFRGCCFAVIPFSIHKLGLAFWRSKVLSKLLKESLQTLETEQPWAIDNLWIIFVQSGPHEQYVLDICLFFCATVDHHSPLPFV